MKYRKGDVDVEAIQYQAADAEPALTLLQQHGALHDRSDDGRDALRVYGAGGGAVDARESDWLVFMPEGVIVVSAADFAKDYHEHKADRKAEAKAQAGQHETHGKEAHLGRKEPHG